MFEIDSSTSVLVIRVLLQKENKYINNELVKKKREKACVTAGGTFGRGIAVNRCHRFFCFNVIFPTLINFCVFEIQLMFLNS